MKFKLGKSSQDSRASVRVACDFGRSNIVFVEMEKKGEIMRLNRFIRIPRPPESDQAAETIRGQFEKNQFTTRKIRLSLKGQGVILRFLSLPRMDAKELKNALLYEIEQYIPFKTDEVLWDAVVIEDSIPLSDGQSGMSVLLAAVKREDIYGLADLFRKAGFEIELVDVDALALINALEFFHPREFADTSGILDIGTEISTLSVIQQGKPRFIRDISYGGMDMLKRLKRKTGLSEEKAVEALMSERPSPEIVPVLKAALDDLISDLRVSLNYYMDQVPSAQPVKHLFALGGGGAYKLTLETLHEHLGIPAEAMHIFDKLQIHPSVDAAALERDQMLLPVAVGLALRDG